MGGNRTGLPPPGRVPVRCPIMCGRFTREYTWKEVHAFLSVLQSTTGEQLPLSYNVAPTQDSAIARLDEKGQREIVIARWGLIPHWADDPAIGNRMINARSETLASKPAFRSAYSKRRCLVPISGFYEWQKVAGRKQPWYIHPNRSSIICLAGLWERWDKGGEPIDSFTIITTNASDNIRNLHDRMPVILSPDEFDAWLNPKATPDQLDQLLDPAPLTMLAAHPVSTRVNSPKNSDPSLTRPVDDESAGLFKT